ncbi:MAG: ATP-binding protein [Verrucomicrobiota bacterium]|nr:ATP-binding protein [Verrucomicrobiota bacterium]
MSIPTPVFIVLILVVLGLFGGLFFFTYRLIIQARKDQQSRRTLEVDLDQAQRALTELHGHYEEAVAAAQRAEDANTAKSTFLATMSHEIRTPLNAVLGMTDVLLSTQVNEEQKDCLSTIKKSGEALLAIIGNVLDYSKIESGKLELSPEMFALAELLGEMELLFRHTAKAKGLNFDCQYDNSQSLRIYCDRNRLRQILINLLSNAIKFTEQGTISLKVVRENIEGTEEDKLKGQTFSQLTFKVADSGIGVPDDKKASIFDPFIQADSSHTRRYGGTGLGLAISRKIIALMNGTVNVYDNNPRGTVFEVVITVRTMVMAKTIAQPFSKPKISTTLATPPATMYKNALAETFYSHNILIVEDDPQNRKVINLILGKMGQKTNFANNGQEALDWLNANPPPDLILMDVGMPVMDGMEATRRIRAGEAGETSVGLPIVALTAYAVTTDREKILASGMNYYLSKPVQTDALREVLTKIARAK